MNGNDRCENTAVVVMKLLLCFPRLSAILYVSATSTSWESVFCGWQNTRWSPLTAENRNRRWTFVHWFCSETIGCNFDVF